MPLFLVLYWCDSPDPKKWKIVQHSTAGEKYEQIPTQAYVLDLPNQSDFVGEDALMIGPYKGQKFMYIFSEYDSKDESKLKEILADLSNDYDIFSDDFQHVILTNVEIASFGEYLFDGDTLYQDKIDDNHIIESDEIGGSIYMARF